MKNTIAIIDSGVEVNHPVFVGRNITCYSVSEGGNIEICTEGCGDECGHGTGVCGLIAKMNPKANIIVYRVFDDELETTNVKLVAALQHIYKENACDIINMSLGTLFFSEELYEICKKITELGILIMAAYDNYGSVSYPAAFESVLGVDVDTECKNMKDYRFYINNIINVGVRDGVFRIADLNGKYQLGKGTSFAVAYFCGYISQKMFDGNGTEDKWKYIKENACEIIECTAANIVESGIHFHIDNATVFPYNKENHSLINFRELLPFEVKHICDIKYSGLINKGMDDIQGRALYVQNIYDDVFSDVDTIIIGQLHDITTLIGEDYLHHIADEIRKYKINVYMFDESLLPFLENYPKEKVYVVQNNQYTRNNNKLFSIEKPVLGIMGTSSIQGKYTLQLQARKYFMNLGYRLGQIGTEPTSYLFGFDYQYAYGYGIREEEIENSANTISKLNKVMHQIDVKDVDLIITGSQSGTVPLVYNNIGQLPIRQQEFLLGCMPDLVILCVNIFDDEQYIRRTIQYIESLVEAKVIGIAIYPKKYKNGWMMVSGIMEEADETELKEYGMYLKQCFQVEVCVMNDIASMERIFSHVIEMLIGE